MSALLTYLYTSLTNVIYMPVLLTYFYAVSLTYLYASLTKAWWNMPVADNRLLTGNTGADCRLRRWIVDKKTLVWWKKYPVENIS